MKRMKRKLKNRSFYTGYDLRKLSVLAACFNRFMTGGQVARLTYIPGEDFDIHKEMVIKSLSRLRHYFKHPYLESHRLKKKRAGFVVYKCLEKGRKVCCELFWRKKRGMTLIWNGKWHVFCETSCNRCQYNPTLQPNYMSIIKEPDTREMMFVKCPKCDYRKTFRVRVNSSQDNINTIKQFYLSKHDYKEHDPSCRDFNDSRRKKRTVF